MVFMDLRSHFHTSTFRPPWVWACFCCLLAASTALALAPIPPLTSPVMDSTGTLSLEQTEYLVEQALQLQHEQGSQLQVLVVSTTKPEDIAQYSQRVFDQWKLGREGVDDGVLLVVAKDDRRVRIHVGYGLEGVLPDIVANRIIDTYVVPKFKAGDYVGGIISGASALDKTIRGAQLPPVANADKPKGGVAALFFSLFETPFGFILFMLVIYVLLRARGGGMGGSGSRRGGGGFSGGGGGGGRSWSGGGGRSGGGGASGRW